ncbi:MAG: aldo/keto reductase [Myxococcota bacterium]
MHALGRTGLHVSRLGLGTGRLFALSEAETFALLDTAYALGVRLFDTAPSYGGAEERLGAWIRGRKPRDVVISTKLGYGVPGVPDWSADCIRLGIEQALIRLGVECIDLVHLHSCPGAVAVEEGIQAALLEAQRAGKVSVLAYSGENEDLDRALSCPSFGAVQLSLSVVDQGSRALRLPSLEARGIGVLVKRPLGNAPWAMRGPAEGPEEEYRRRFAALELEEPAIGWADFALRFSAFSPGVHAVLLGTQDTARLALAVKALEAGPLPEALRVAVIARWEARAAGWRGVV